MGALVYRLHVRYRWLRYWANYYGGLWRFIVCRYRTWKLMRWIRKHPGQINPKWIPIYPPAFGEKEASPFVQTKTGRIQDLTDEDLEGFDFCTDD